MLTRDQIKATNDLPGTVVDVPEWGGQVLVRGLNGRERDNFEQSMLSMAGPSISLNMENARARLVAAGCIDESGAQLFTPADVEWLAEKSGAALDRVYQVIQKLSGLSAGDMKELTENFTVSLGGGSTSN